MEFPLRRSVALEDFYSRYGVGRACGVGRGLGDRVPLGVLLGVAVGLAVGVAVAVEVGVGIGVAPDCAQYLPPVLKTLPLYPPQTTISLPVQTTV